MGTIQQWSALGRTIDRLKKLKTGWSIPPALMLAYSIIDAISNIDFVVELFRKIELMPAWSTVSAVITSGVGNLVCALTGTTWLGYLILRPEPKDERPGGTVSARKTESRDLPQTTENEPVLVPSEVQSETVAKIDHSEIKITAMVKRDEIAGEFFNDTGGKLKCSVWIADLGEWNARFGYLDKQQTLAPCCLVRSRTIDPQTKYDTYTKLIYREGRRLCVRGLVDGRQDREQVFNIVYPENIWTLTVEVKIESGSERVARQNISFRCPDEKSFELTATPEPKPPS